MKLQIGRIYIDDHGDIYIPKYHEDEYLISYFINRDMVIEYIYLSYYTLNPKPLNNKLLTILFDLETK